MQFSGIIKYALQREQGEKNGRVWTRQKFVVEDPTQSERTQSVLVTVLKTSLLEWMATNVGQYVTIDIDLVARTFNSKWYQDLTCWACSFNGARVGVGQRQQQYQPQQQYQQPQYQPQPQPQPQQQGNGVYQANNVPPTQPQPQAAQEAEEDLPF